MEYIKITLQSDLCSGSGESNGNAVDQEICTSSNGFPVIFARRIKGCLRQSAEFLNTCDSTFVTSEQITRLFGDSFGTEGCLQLDDAVLRNAPFMEQKIEEIKSGLAPAYLKEAVHPVEIEKLFTSVRGQTKLENGVKVDNTLRFTRVLNQYDPFSINENKKLVFYAPVWMTDEDKELRDLLEKSCSATRHMGLNRNRGLGNVKVELISEVTQEKKVLVNDSSDKKGRVVISYQISLDSAVTLPGCGELHSAIPARSIIGCMAGAYLKDGSADTEDFRKLFLDGTVVWSELTPVIQGEKSIAVPMFINQLKNAGGKLINRFAVSERDWNNYKKLKPKTQEGSYAAIKDNRWLVGDIEVHTQYHNRINGRMLYMQESIDAGYIYGGLIEAPADMAEIICKLLKDAKLRFGRSKNIQYSCCNLYGEIRIWSKKNESIKKIDGEPVFVILKSDLALLKDGLFITQADEVRKALASVIGVADVMPAGYTDIIRYHTIGGFQNKWQLQKEQIPVIRSGSVYCFVGTDIEIKKEYQIGAYKQEGFGLCTVYSLSDMKKLSEVASGSVDRKKIEYNDDTGTDRMVAALLLQRAREEMAEYARHFTFVDEKQIPVARLRLMLSEATSLADLMNRVETMKTSDESSERERGKKKTSKDIIQQFYGFEKSKEVNWGQLMNGNNALADAIIKDSKMKEKLEKQWKQPFEQFLKNTHYSK